MELKELSEKVKPIFGTENIDELPKRIFDVVKNNDVRKYEEFFELVKDLSVDWLQMIYQYYLADRKEKMQDYTPKSLALFMGKLIGDADVIVDLCAGSGALTIQKWCMNHEQKFELYEFDENVIPFLSFNMAIRNIECIVYHSDVLQQEILHTYKISRGEKYGKFREVTK